MAQLNVGKGPDYKCSPNNGNFQFPNSTTLSVNPSSEGCTIIFSTNVPAQNGQTTYNFQNGTQQDIDFSGFTNGTSIKYCTTAYLGTCNPNSLSEDTGHTITIDSGTGGRLHRHDTAHTISVDSSGS